MFIRSIIILFVLMVALCLASCGKGKLVPPVAEMHFRVANEEISDFMIRIEEFGLGYGFEVKKVVGNQYSDWVIFKVNDGIELKASWDSENKGRVQFYNRNSVKKLSKEINTSLGKKWPQTHFRFY